MAAGNPFLLIAAALDAAAASIHMGAIAGGLSWYRFLGAGDKMVRALQRGSSRPTQITLAITAALLMCSVYALSGAGTIPKLVGLRPILCGISGIFLARGVLFAPLQRFILGNSRAFWIWSSVICFLIGGMHLIGTIQAWAWL